MNNDERIDDEMTAEDWRLVFAHRRLTPHVCLIIWRLHYAARWAR